MRITSAHILQGPHTKLGRWSAGLGIAFILTFILNIFVNMYIMRPSAGQPLMTIYMVFVIAMLACGLAGGITGLIAITRKHERSPLTWISILLGLFVLLLILNELWQGFQYISQR